MKSKSIIISLLLLVMISLFQISEAQTITVVSDGLNGKELVKDLKNKGIIMSNIMLPILNYYDFLGTRLKGDIHKLVIIRGSEIPIDTNKPRSQCIEKIKEFGESKGYTNTTIEVAELLRKNITSEELKKMGYTNLIVIHNPIQDSDGTRLLFGMDDENNFYCCLCYGGLLFQDLQKIGFVFECY